MARAEPSRRRRRARSGRLLLCWLASACLLPAAAAIAGDATPRYATTPFLEPDRCATAWVIQRYLHPDAVFEFQPREELPADAILIDLPEAELKRDARRAAVEVLIAREKVGDAFAVRLAGLVHDIEINAWARRDRENSSLFERVLMERMHAVEPADAQLRVCFELLDRLRELKGDIGGWAESIEGGGDDASDALPGSR